MKLRAPAVFVFALALALPLSAQHPFSAPGWALRIEFPTAPAEDDQRIPTPQGDQLAERRHAEHEGGRFLLVRMVFPLVVPAQNAERVFREAAEFMMTTRAGELVMTTEFMLGHHAGRRLVIAHEQDRSHREVRLVLVGGSLYVASAEWKGGKTPAAAAARFLDSLEVLPEFADPRAADERERWRNINEGNFTLRYDASRWFRDPNGAEPGVVVLLRADELAEAEFVTSPESQGDGPLGDAVLTSARENAESVRLHRRGRKLRGMKTVEELRFAAHVEGVTYENHGYFYRGPEGTVQVRAWASDRNFARVEGDIAELLDGLTIAASRNTAGR